MSLCHLPFEMIEEIGTRLGNNAFLRFRGTCRYIAKLDPVRVVTLKEYKKTHAIRSGNPRRRYLQRFVLEHEYANEQVFRFLWNECLFLEMLRLISHDSDALVGFSSDFSEVVFELKSHSEAALDEQSSLAIRELLYMCTDFVSACAALVNLDCLAILHHIIRHPHELMTCKKDMLRLAVLDNNSLVFSILLNLDVIPVHEKDSYGEYLIHLVVKSGNVQMLRMLLAKNVNIRVKDGKGDEPFKVALIANESIMLQELSKEISRKTITK